MESFVHVFHLKGTPENHHLFSTFMISTSVFHVCFQNSISPPGVKRCALSSCSGDSSPQGLHCVLVYHYKRMVYFMENPKEKWMVWGDITLFLLLLLLL
jgi:hypothetical protein